MDFEYADGRMPVAMTYQGAVYYFGYDQVGSLRVVTDAAGTVVKRIDYDSFGNILSDSTPSFSIPFGFAGGLHDRDTSLVRFGARDYDPATGKWTAKDPIDFAGGDLNLGSYVGQDPVNWVDPEGESWQMSFGGSLVGIDISSVWYDSEKGWFPLPGKTELGVSTTLFGGGFQFLFEDEDRIITPAKDDILVSIPVPFITLSKYLAVHFNPELSRGGFSVGLGLGLPISFSTSLEHFIEHLTEYVDRLTEKINAIGGVNTAPCN